MIIVIIGWEAKSKTCGNLPTKITVNFQNYRVKIYTKRNKHRTSITHTQSPQFLFHSSHSSTNTVHRRLLKQGTLTFNSIPYSIQSSQWVVVFRFAFALFIHKTITILLFFHTFRGCFPNFLVHKILHLESFEKILKKKRNKIHKSWPVLNWVIFWIADKRLTMLWRMGSLWSSPSKWSTFTPNSMSSPGNKSRTIKAHLTSEFWEAFAYCSNKILWKSETIEWLISNVPTDPFFFAKKLTRHESTAPMHSNSIDLFTF